MTCQPVILMRKSLSEEDEFRVASDTLPVYELRTRVPENSLVIGRYSVLPYYRELELDLESRGCKLINSYHQHRWIANLHNWYSDFEDLTPKTWKSIPEITEGGPYVLKGETNSLKFQWKTHMFAQTRADAVAVMGRIMADSLLGSQGICIRKYEPLVQVATSLSTSPPITNEYRTFFLDGKPIETGFYWSAFDHDLEVTPTPPPQSFLLEVGSRLKARFVVVDTALTQTGKWIVIEINDGQMSGLSDCDPTKIYTGLSLL